METNQMITFFVIGLIVALFVLACLALITVSLLVLVQPQCKRRKIEKILLLQKQFYQTYFHLNPTLKTSETDLTIHPSQAALQQINFDLSKTLSTCWNQLNELDLNQANQTGKNLLDDEQLMKILKRQPHRILKKILLSWTNLNGKLEWILFEIVTDKLFQIRKYDQFYQAVYCQSEQANLQVVHQTLLPTDFFNEASLKRLKKRTEAELFNEMTVQTFLSNKPKFSLLDQFNESLKAKRNFIFVFELNWKNHSNKNFCSCNLGLLAYQFENYIFAEVKTVFAFNNNHQLLINHFNDPNLASGHLEFLAALLIWIEEHLKLPQTKVLASILQPSDNPDLELVFVQIRSYFDNQQTQADSQVSEAIIATNEVTSNDNANDDATKQTTS